MIQSGYNLFKIYKDTRVVTNNLVYTNTGKINYFVSIKENDFISTPIMASGQTYITSLVDKITMTMSYTYKAGSAMDIDADHKIIANIVGLYNENPNSTKNPSIWEKEYTIKSLSKETYNNKDEIKIVETFEIDLSIYNDEANRFKTEFSIPSITYLEVIMPVNLEGNTNEYELKEAYRLMAKIPLTEQVFYITASGEDIAEKLVPSKLVEEINIDQRKLSIHLMLFIGALVLNLITIKKIMDSGEVEEFHSQIDKLKSEFNEIVVETDNMVDARELKPIVITTFDEMLNLATSLEMPIILYEENNLAVFYIVKGDIIYSYLLKRDRVKKTNQ
jgi:hypothetical protein